MDVVVTLLLMITAGVLTPIVRRLLDLLYGKLALQMRKMNEGRNHR